MLKLNNFLLFLFGCLLSFSSFSQTKDELKKQKTELEKEISYTTELLNKTKKNKTKSLNYLKVLESQIKSKEQLLITLHIEITLINKQIKKTERSIIDTKESILKKAENLQHLKEEYAKINYITSDYYGIQFSFACGGIGVDHRRRTFSWHGS